MSESKHTPGPWKACLNVPNATIEGHIIKADHGAECPIASLWVGGGTQGKPMQIANARLIAAAPVLLDACKKASYMNCRILTRDKPDWLLQIEAAITKAEKEE